MEFNNYKDLCNYPTYLSNELPASIGYAIYSFGSSDIKEILAFIDMSDDLNGSEGVIITPTHFYYTNGVIEFSQVKRLETNLHKEYLQVDNLRFRQFNTEVLMELFQEATDLFVYCQGTNNEQIEYYTSMIIQDLEDDVYEDISFTIEQSRKLTEIKDSLAALKDLSDEDYIYETDCILHIAYPLFEELELDSEEMDELEKLNEAFEEKQVAQQQNFENATHYYEDMINNLRNGNPQMYNQMKNLMKMVGLDEEDLKNKSPEELNEMLDSLCKRFGVSREQVEAFARKYQK